MKTNITTVEEITQAITVKSVGDLECWTDNAAGYQFTVPVTFEFEGKQFEVYYQEDAQCGFGLMPFSLNDDEDVNRLIDAVCDKYGFDISNDHLAIECVKNAGLAAAEAEYETRHFGLDAGDHQRQR